jgi:hypothetical protein
LRQIDLDAAMAQSANAATPVVGTTTEPALTTVPALEAVRADLDGAARQGVALVAAIDQRSAAGYAAHGHATAALVDIDADNAQALAAIKP